MREFVDRLTKSAGIINTAIVLIVLLVLYVLHNVLLDPHANKSPQHNVIINGAFPYSEGYELELRASFRTSNPVCKRNIMDLLVFSAARSDRSISQPVQVRRGPSDTYVAEISIDHYKPGFCEWKYAGMSYGFRGKRLPESRYVALGPGPEKFNTVALKCELLEVKKLQSWIVSCRKLLEINDQNIPVGSSIINFEFGGE